MRHATDADLEPFADLLVRLRELEPLKERTTGSFYLRSRAFLHFHADGDDLYADVRLTEPDFDRRRVTTADEQADLLVAVARRLGLSN